ncbi:hypothetical protein NQ317_006089 [Molorchus minor]|uniref:Uncharacterized protein n=1 Tax=Molorchus minor TaxID=1323400 RepID=A0ABQ9ISS8_9CUCU|nr:hypothetical protein NQ317_006089 [Molorchus minor]
MQENILDIASDVHRPPCWLMLGKILRISSPMPTGNQLLSLKSYIEGSVANKLKIGKKIAGNDMPLNIPLNVPSTSCDNIEKDLRQPFDIVTNNKLTDVEQVTISNYVRQDKHHEYVYPKIDINNCSNSY